MAKRKPPAPGGEILLYQTEDGTTRLEVQIQGETVWLSQAQMSELFQTTKQNISLHIRNIYDERELTRSGTVKDSLTVQDEGIPCGVMMLMRLPIWRPCRINKFH